MMSPSRVISFPTMSPLTTHSLRLWRPKLAERLSWESSLEVLLDSPLRLANPSCSRRLTMDAMKGSDRTNQFHAEASAGLQPDCVLRFQRHRPRRSKWGSV